MSTFIDKCDNKDKIDNVKFEPMDIKEIASSITIKEQDNENKLQILNLIIERETDENKITQLYIERIAILFHMDKWHGK
ncbi:unnamed protein product [Adineta steineri]|uniref:Uncharacterized protein n=1 Tax=Adineta steineri TaxID=433720 RepID=A0A816ADA5_9BILA|nr:unnamed protein product [Adineta steineri]